MPCAVQNIDVLANHQPGININQTLSGRFEDFAFIASKFCFLILLSGRSYINILMYVDECLERSNDNSCLLADFIDNLFRGFQKGKSKRDEHTCRRCAV